MRTIFLFILAISLSISSYSQVIGSKKSSGGKMNTVKSVKSGRSDKHVPTEGDGTGDKIVGQMPRRVRHVYTDFIKDRQKFGQRRYTLKTAGGEPIKPNFKK
jgi:hypothetical protein